MAILPHEHILRLHGAVLSSSLASCRAALLCGIDPAVASGLPICATESSQILSDLCGLNAVEQLADGTVPLRTWLASALALAKPRPEGEVFRECLREAVGTRSIAHGEAPSPGDELADELLRIGRSVFLARGHQLTRSLYEVEALLARCPHHVEARMLKERIQRALASEDRILGGTRCLVGGGETRFSVQPWLRAPPIHFIGRETQLLELAKQAGRAGVLICGLGGMGKTALALALVRMLAPHYPDLQISIDLQGTSAEPLSLFDTMTQVIRSFLPGVPLPDRMEEVAHLYRGVLAGQRTLILLEDARDQAQVEPLVPPEGSLLVVTSRRRFSLPDFHMLSLDRLEGADAQVLLQRLAQRVDDAAARRVADLCGRVPGALRLAGGALTRRLDLTPDAYVDRLEVALSRDDLLDAAFSVNLLLLDSILQILWSRLSVFPTYFSSSDAERVGYPFMSTDEDLSALVAYRMLEREPGTRRYRLPRAAQRLARSLMPETDRERAQKRAAVRHELLSYSRHRSMEEDKLTVREAELRWTRFLHARRESRSTGLESAFRAARRVNNRPAEAMYLEGMAEALGTVSEAATLAEQALPIYQEYGDRAGEIRILSRLVEIHESLEDERRGVERGDQLLAILRELGDRHGERELLEKLALLHGRLKNYRRAAICHEQCFSFSLQYSSPDVQAADARRLSATYRKLGELDKAIKALQTCVDIELAAGLCDSPMRAVDLARLRALREKTRS